MTALAVYLPASIESPISLPPCVIITFAVGFKVSIPVCTFEAGCLKDASEVVDCLLGTGFQGNVRENYCAAMEEINNCGAFVVSVDINSGMNGDTGEGNLIVRSDLTVTIGFVKHGLVKPNAGTYMKRLVCADIGIRLFREESKLCTEGEYHPNAIAYPHWLDRNVIRV